MTIVQPWPTEGPLFLSVTGPAPFNTLVVAQGITESIQFNYTPDGNLHLGTITGQTNFVLPQFDPRQPPPKFQHSTMAWLTSLVTAGVSNITGAINDISNAYFDYTGRWTLVLDVAALAENNTTLLSGYGEAGFAMISSWVLCTLPPVTGA